MFLVVCLLCAASASHAVYRRTSITVGQHTIGGYPEDYYYYPYFDEDDTGFGSCFSPGPDTNGQIGNSGQITVTYTWDNEGDPLNLPPQAIVKFEDSWAYWGGPYEGIATGSCSSGLDHEVVSTGTNGASCTGHRYTIVQNPGNTVTFTCSPSSSVDDYGYDPYNTASNAGVSYVWNIQEVHLDLGGTTRLSPHGQHHILIGQRASAGISSPGTVSNYQWSVSGDTFDRFDVAYDFNAHYSTGHAYPVDASEWASSGPTWYWKKEGNATVSVTAKITYAGEDLGNVSLHEDNVDVQAPNYYFGNDTGRVLIEPSSGSHRLIATSSPGVSEGGSNWEGWMETPEIFTQNGTQYGMWHFVQLINPGRSKTLDNSTSLICTENGLIGLDTFYPYPDWGTSGNFNSGGPGWIADHGLWNTNDSPATGLWDTLPAVDSVLIDENFEVYMMYYPPGNNSEWVPLHKFSWRWYADDLRPEGTVGGNIFRSWGFWPSNQLAGYVARQSSVRCYDHPDWIRIEGPTHVGSNW